MIEQARSIDVEPTSDGGVWICAAAGRLRLMRLGPSVVRLDMDGHAYAGFAEAMAPSMNEMLATSGRLFIAVDAEGLRSYEPRFRYLWTEWIKANQAGVEGIIVLFRSRLVHSATVIINAVTGRELIETYADRDAFEDRLVATIRGHGDCRDPD